MNNFSTMFILLTGLMFELFFPKKEEAGSRQSFIFFSHFGLEYTKIVRNPASVYFNSMFLVAFGDFFEDRPKLENFLSKQGAYLLKGGEYEATKDVHEMKKVFRILSKKFKKSLRAFSKIFQEVIQKKN